MALEVHNCRPDSGPTSSLSGTFRMSDVIRALSSTMSIVKH